MSTCNSNCTNCTNCTNCNTVVVDDCTPPTSVSLPSCAPQYCDDGCKEFLQAKCIIFSDGESLETKFNQLLTFMQCICEDNPQCNNAGTGSGTQICV